MKVSLNRIWEMCHFLYREERTIEAIMVELGLPNKEAAKKAVERFRVACRRMNIELVTRSDSATQIPSTYEVTTPDWRNRCLHVQKAISKSK